MGDGEEQVAMTDFGRDLKFGYFLVPNAADPLLATAHEIERLGLDYVAVQDHPYQRRFVDTWTLLAMIAATTSRVGVFPDVANLALRPRAQGAAADRPGGRRLGAVLPWRAAAGPRHDGEAGRGRGRGGTRPRRGPPRAQRQRDRHRRALRRQVPWPGGAVGRRADRAGGRARLRHLRLLGRRGRAARTVRRGGRPRRPRPGGQGTRVTGPPAAVPCGGGAREALPRTFDGGAGVASLEVVVHDVHRLHERVRSLRVGGRKVEYPNMCSTFC